MNSGKVKARGMLPGSPHPFCKVLFEIALFERGGSIMYKVCFHSTDEKIGFLGGDSYPTAVACAEFLAKYDWGGMHPKEKCGDVYMTISFMEVELAPEAMLLIVCILDNLIDLAEDLGDIQKARAMEGISKDFGGR